MLIVLIAVSILRWTNAPEKQEMPFENFSEFITAVEKGKVKKVNIITENNYQVISGVTTDGKQFTLEAPKNYPQLIDKLLANNVVYDQEQTPQPPWWTGVLSTLLPVLLLIGVFFFMMQQTQGGGSRVMQFGKSRARLHTDEKTRVTFADVAGADEVKEELEEVVEFLKYPKKFTELGAKIPKGVLLFGPPGTGKTLLARAVAGEAGVPFFSISGSDFVEMFVGVGASRVRDLFEQAKKNAPCIVFVDEIDAVGRQRGAGLGGGHDEREQTLNQLLVEMDGFNVNEGIIIIAATNRPDILDPALLRPGRFDRQITVDRPDVKGREEILKVHVRGKPLAENTDLAVLARGTPGFTGADLANLVNEAALLAARRGKKTISMTEMEQAIERVIAGPEKKSRVISEFEKKIVSYHEAGHALVAELLPHCDPLHKVSIIPRGRAGGYTLLLPREDRNYMTRSQLLDQITMMLGGRVAEQIVLNEISTGAQNDLERATGTVRKMITEWGMSDELGPITFGNKQEQVFLGRDIARDRNYSEAVAFAIDKEVRRIMEEAYQKAEKLLRDNLDKLHLIAETLMEKEVIEAEEFAELMKKVTDSPKRNEDERTPQMTIKADEDIINNDDEGPEDTTIKITFRRDS
ncbi:MAG: cell division protease FtsH [Clostridia bacterium]|jgi:cell division protease FtsH|nr:cell division protease FtsH [Clostridia bacterium]